MADDAERHLHAQRLHEEAALRHEAAARFWVEQKDEERADLERRNARIERDAADLEADRAALERRRTVRSG